MMKTQLAVNAKKDKTTRLNWEKNEQQQQENTTEPLFKIILDKKMDE